MFRTAAGFAILALAVTLVASRPAAAETVAFQADLKASAQVPPNDSKGSGSAKVTYDTSTKTLTWTITYTNLTGDPTAAHFHGPAEAGKNAGPVVPLPGSLASPIQGSAVISDAQASDLMAGLWYINIHTATNPGGEIRGQVVKAN